MGGLRLCHCWRGQKRLHTWKPQLLFAYSLYTLYWTTMTIIKGRLHVIAMVKKLKFFGSPYTMYILKKFWKCFKYSKLIRNLRDIFSANEN